MTHPTKLHEALATLKEARQYIVNPDTWVCGTLGRLTKDHPIQREWSHDESCIDAPRVCSWGAISKVKNVSAADLGYSLRTHDLPAKADCSIAFLHEASRQIGGFDIVNVNDAMGHEKTIEMWDRAIVNCEQAIREHETGKQIEAETSNGDPDKPI